MHGVHHRLLGVVEQDVRSLELTQVEVSHVVDLSLRDIPVIEHVPEVRVLLDIPCVCYVVPSLSGGSHVDNEGF